MVLFPHRSVFAVVMHFYQKKKKKKKGGLYRAELHVNTRTEEINSLTPTTACFSSLMKYPVGLENGCYSTRIHIICTRQEECHGCLVLKTAGNIWEQTKEMSRTECRTVTATRMSLLDQQLTSECDKSVSESNFQQPTIYTTPHIPS